MFYAADPSMRQRHQRAPSHQGREVKKETKFAGVDDDQPPSRGLKKKDGVVVGEGELGTSVTSRDARFF